jgi:hypothetical protein
MNGRTRSCLSRSAKKSWTGSTCEDAANLAIETGPVSASATRTKGAFPWIRRRSLTTLRCVAASLPPGIQGRQETVEAPLSRAFRRHLD